MSECDTRHLLAHEGRLGRHIVRIQFVVVGCLELHDIY